ncbi:MAG: septal ring lytic transglycosylase RlpA family protein [Rhodocyclaceae bacterium]
MERLVSLRAVCAAFAITAASAPVVARQLPPEAESKFMELPPAPAGVSPESGDDRAPVETFVPLAPRKAQAGHASFYANRFHGRRTASGRIFRNDAYTAAHRTLPMGAWVKVTNTRNSRSVIVQITDRGPYVRRRIIDLSRVAAGDLGMLRSGTAPVRVEVVPAELAQAPRLNLADGTTIASRDN